MYKENEKEELTLSKVRTMIGASEAIISNTIQNQLDKLGAQGIEVKSVNIDLRTVNTLAGDFQVILSETKLNINLNL